MEREKELAKWINVLRRTARAAMQAQWTGGDEDAAAFSTQQYNNVLARLTALDPTLGEVFEPLAPESSLSVVAMACRQLAAYYEDEVGRSPGWAKAYGAAFDTDSFKTFWQRCAGDIEDLGEYIRESVDTWAREHRHETTEKTGHSNEPQGE